MAISDILKKRGLCDIIVKNKEYGYGTIFKAFREQRAATGAAE